ncbi:MAG: hydroxymethylglutaryl-CoA synthase [Firmicutes bacterium]|nr:hydroxymethylglutaryl-CoA synthase [Bacillota bacterium]
MAGIIGYGVYIPGLRIAAKEIKMVWPVAGGVPGVKEKAVADFDEDTVTMAVTAAERALANAGIGAEKVEAVYVASTSAPCEEKSMAAVIQTVLGVPSGALSVDLGRSTRAGTLALMNCLAQVRAGDIKLGLVIASENRLARAGDMLEQSLGAGAVALVVGNERTIAEVLGSATFTTEFTSTWRPCGEKYLRRHDDVRLEREYGFQRAAVKAGQTLLARLGLTGEVFNYLATAEPDGRIIQTVAKMLRLPAEAAGPANLAPVVGDTGTVAPLLGLAAILEQGKQGEKALVISYGSGAGSDALAVELTGELAVKKEFSKALAEITGNRTYLNYHAYAKRVGLLPVPPALPDPLSGYGNQPGMLRDAEYLLALKALECESCGSLNYPYRDYCIDCRSQSFREVRLPRRGRIVTYNVQYVSPIGPEEPPVVVCTVKLDGAGGVRGGKVSGAMVMVDPARVRVGLPVELVFRRCGEELGLPKYGYKFKPLTNLINCSGGACYGA